MSNSGGNGGGSNGTVDSMARSSQISPISHKKIPRNLNDKLSGTLGSGFTNSGHKVIKK